MLVKESTSSPRSVKKDVPNTRSKITRKSELATTEVAMSVMADDAPMECTKIGNRQKVRPLARIRIIVTRRLMAPKTEENPAVAKASKKNNFPMGPRVLKGA